MQNLIHGNVKTFSSTRVGSITSNASSSLFSLPFLLDTLSDHCRKKNISTDKIYNRILLVGNTCFHEPKSLRAALYCISTHFPVETSDLLIPYKTLIPAPTALSHPPPRPANASAYGKSHSWCQTMWASVLVVLVRAWGLCTPRAVMPDTKAGTWGATL